MVIEEDASERIGVRLFSRTPRARQMRGSLDWCGTILDKLYRVKTYCVLSRDAPEQRVFRSAQSFENPHLLVLVGGGSGTFR